MPTTIFRLPKPLGCLTLLLLVFWVNLPGQSAHADDPLPIVTVTVARGLHQFVNVRAHPTPDAAVIGALRTPAEANILGATADGLWLNGQLDDGLTGWLPADQVTVATYTVDLAAPVEHNADWQPFWQFDGVAMVLTPVGCFDMGVNGAGGRQCFDQPFWIDRYEVTNAEYRECVTAGICAPPDDLTFYSNGQYNDYPVVFVSWYQASDYAEWRGCRLPTEAEWEYAARGPANLLFPWGNEFVPENVVFLTPISSSYPSPLAVDSRPAGVSWVGAYHLSGNVFEWTRSIYALYPYDAADGRESLADLTVPRIQRGGSWGCGSEIYLRVDFYRPTQWPYTTNEFVGIRLVCSY